MKREKLSKAAASGAVALIFLVLGFQAAIFTGNVFRRTERSGGGQADAAQAADSAAQAAPPAGGPSAQGGRTGGAAPGKSSAGGGKPAWGRGSSAATGGASSADSVGGASSVASSGGASAGTSAGGAPAQGASHKGAAGVVAGGLAPKKEYPYSDSRRVLEESLKKKPEPESFPFDPNTVTVEALVRLGLSERQAQVIENYRNKGGRYYKPEDFAKMYVVDSALFRRLKPYIKLKKLDLNSADSTDLLQLRGIGPYYAGKIIRYRARLGGAFTSVGQLLEIDGFEAERLARFADGVETASREPQFTLWSATKSELAAHPYIGSYAAKGIARYKSVTDSAQWSLGDLVKNGVLDSVSASRLLYLAGGEGHHE